MATSNPIILGGGISKGTPFTLGALLRVSNVTPPTAADSEVFQRTQGGVEVITVGTPWGLSAAFTEKLQVVGGLISDTAAGASAVIMGQGTFAPTFAASRNVVIGGFGQFNATQVGLGNVNLSYNVVIGAGAYVAGTNTLGNNVVIGAGSGFAYSAGTQTGQNIIIGANITVANIFDGVVIGGSAIISAGGTGVTGVFIGRQVQATATLGNAVAVGNIARVDAANTIALGDGARARALTSIAIGRNADATTPNGIVIGAQNLGIFDVLVGEGLLTTSGTSPTDILWHSTGSQGVDQPGNVNIYQASLGTGAANTGGAFRWRTGTPGVSSFNGQAPATRLEILPAQNAAGASINFIGTNSPAAAVGTLLNAPTAGNPEWMPILFNGNIRYVPCWP